MTNIVEEFAYDNVCPNDQYFKKDSEFGRAMELVTRTKQTLLDRLGTDDKGLFQKYINTQGEVNRLRLSRNLFIATSWG